MSANEQPDDREYSSVDPSQDWLFDAFSEPRTMPGNWDLSEMKGAVKAPGNGEPAQAAEGHEPAVDQPENEDSETARQQSYLDPFSEPRTYPANWDLDR